MPPDAPDPSRRQFFRSFSREALQAAAHVVGMASALQRGTGAAASELLGLAAAPPEEAAAKLAGAAAGGPFAGAPGEPLATPAGIPFRSPYRIEDEVLVLLDQRRYPDALEEVRCITFAELAAAMRARRVRGPAVLAQLAGYGVWLAALRARGMHAPLRPRFVHASADALRLAAGNVGTVPWALERVVTAWDAATAADVSGEVAADAARAAADATAQRFTLDLSRLARLGAAALPQPDGRPLEVLTLDSTGPLAGGMVGTALGVVQAIAAEGRAVHVWLLETRPFLSGARLGSWELAQAGIPVTVVADGSAAWLLAKAGLDVVLVGADRLAADGAVTAVIGTRGLAELAHLHTVPLWAVAPLAALDPDVPDAASSPVDAEAYTTIGAQVVPPSLAAAPGVEARGPLQDVTPPELLEGLLTEAGLLRPPFGEALAAARAVAAGVVGTADPVAATEPAGVTGEVRP